MTQPTPRTDSHEAFKAPFDFIRRREIKGNATKIELKDLDIRTPKEKKLLIEQANVTINAGDHVAFIGPNGSGKSSLFRVLRGLTHEGNGHATITLPENGETFVASQEIRKASMILPGLLAYPHPPENYTQAQMEDALHDADLEIAIEHLPANAVQPEKLLEILIHDLEVLMDFGALNLTLESAAPYFSGLKQSLDKHFRMPESLQNYFTEEKKIRTIDVIGTFLAGYYAALSNQEEFKHRFQKSAIFPEWKGRRHGRAFADHAVSVIDGWLLQGQRMTLSGGQQQRLVFARAFLQAPHSDLFLLDEPTSALKGETAHEMIEKLFEKTKGKTVIAIIHDTSLLKHFSHLLELHSDKSLTLSQLGHAPAPQNKLAAPETGL